MNASWGPLGAPEQQVLTSDRCQPICYMRKHFGCVTQIASGTASVSQTTQVMENRFHLYYKHIDQYQQPVVE